MTISVMMRTTICEANFFLQNDPFLNEPASYGTNTLICIITVVLFNEINDMKLNRMKFFDIFMISSVLLLMTQEVHTWFATSRQTRLLTQC